MERESRQYRHIKSPLCDKQNHNQSHLTNIIFNNQESEESFKLMCSKCLHQQFKKNDQVEFLSYPFDFINICSSLILELKEKSQNQQKRQQLDLQALKFFRKVINDLQGLENFFQYLKETVNRKFVQYKEAKSEFQSQGQQSKIQIVLERLSQVSSRGNSQTEAEEELKKLKNYVQYDGQQLVEKTNDTAKGDILNVITRHMNFLETIDSSNKNLFEEIKILCENLKFKHKNELETQSIISDYQYIFQKFNMNNTLENLQVFNLAENLDLNPEILSPSPNAINLEINSKFLKLNNEVSAEEEQLSQLQEQKENYQKMENVEKQKESIVQQEEEIQKKESMKQKYSNDEDLAISIEAPQKAGSLETQKIDQNRRSTNLQFSNAWRSQAIQIYDDGLLAIRDESEGQQSLILLDKSVSELQFWTIQIKSLESWICIGMASKKILEQNQFTLQNQNDLGHGCFILSSDQFKWNHNNQQENGDDNGLIFRNGDIICMSYHPPTQKIYFNWHNNKKYFLNVEYQEYEDLYPVVGMYYHLDTVQII